MLQNNLVEIRDFLRKGGGVPIITSWSGGFLGPGTSRCLVPAKRGRGMSLTIGHALRSKRGGGYVRSLLHLLFS